MKQITPFCAILLVAPCFAQDTCKQVNAALDKYLSMPFHIYTTRTMAAKPGADNSEMISAGGTLFILSRGKWIRSGASPQDMRPDRTEKSKAPHECRMLRSEPVDGEAASVYSISQTNEVAKIDSTLWISNSRGLPLKQEMDMDVGGAAGKSHTVVRFDYRNVSPPPGVH